MSEGDDSSIDRFAQGCRAFDAGEAMNSNPYPVGTVASFDWQAGWQKSAQGRPPKPDGRRERCMEWLRAEAQADTDLATHAAGGCFSDPAMAAECGVCKSLLRFVEAECEREREECAGVADQHWGPTGQKIAEQIRALGRGEGRP